MHIVCMHSLIVVVNVWGEGSGSSVKMWLLQLSGVDLWQLNQSFSIHLEDSSGRLTVSRDNYLRHMYLYKYVTTNLIGHDTSRYLGLGCYMYVIYTSHHSHAYVPQCINHLTLYTMYIYACVKHVYMYMQLRNSNDSVNKQP